VYPCLFVCSLPVLVPFALAFEAKDLLKSNVWSDGQLALIAGGGVVAAGFMSFLLILLELSIVKATSALSTDVIGYVKNISIILISGVTFGDALSPLNIVGVVVTFSGALMYSYLRRQPARKPADSEKVAYEILSVLEMAQNWSDDEDMEGSVAGVFTDPLDLTGDDSPPSPLFHTDPVFDGATRRSKHPQATDDAD
jgi:hypothetical protein